MASIKYKNGSSWVDIRNTLYPVGSIYMSTSSTSPATLFGGTWSQISGALLGATGTPIRLCYPYWLRRFARYVSDWKCCSSRWRKFW